jgi:acetyl esterase
MPLDPVVAQMLKQMAESNAPATADSTPGQARARYMALQSRVPAPHVMSIENACADDVAIRIYRPSIAPKPCIVYFHGGGWVLGDLESHDGVCRQLALAADMTIIAVDYRLSPEHPFPAALDDCYNTVCWIAQNAARLDIDADRIAVAGDSAGGNLAAAVCLRSRQTNGPDIAFQLLIYPVTDSGMDTPSYTENAEGYLLSRTTMAWFWQQYTGNDDSHRLNALAAPLQADDLSDLPPACIITAEFDPLRDEGRAFAERLKAEGVSAHYEEFAGMIHSFFGMTDTLAAARDAMQLAADQLKTALEGN